MLSAHVVIVSGPSALPSTHLPGHVRSITPHVAFARGTRTGKCAQHISWTKWNQRTPSTTQPQRNECKNNSPITCPTQTRRKQALPQRPARKKTQNLVRGAQGRARFPLRSSLARRHAPRKRNAELGCVDKPAIAQLVEHLTVDSCSNQMVPGSIPGGRTF